ncbi:MAG: aldo/keto reductase [Oscillospiraceae bacterium]|nr:aldo/keto reductase [Oscillospiraceae bacterium]
MRRVRLGARGPEVSRLCFGTLTMGPLQRDMSPQDGAALLCYAANRGIDFVDTAEIYGTYPHIALALRRHPQLKVCTKTYACDAAEAAKSLALAQQGIGRAYIDVFMLHEQESEHTLRGHEEALRYLAEKKREGLVGAIGISTHHVAAVRAAIRFGRNWGGLDVVHPIFNRKGLGVVDGTRADMEEACAQAKAHGMGVLAMKPLGGGHLIGAPQSAFGYVLTHPAVDAVAVGMQSTAEIDYNLAVFEGCAPAKDTRRICARAPRRAMVHDWCAGCAACVQRCDQQAIAVREGRAHIDAARCVRCGYCATVCPQFCIKII